jgi:hypothetical protein
MRLWSLHPCYLDTKGLLAAWREGLLAQKVLAGGTKGYRNHPQLHRFRASADPLAMIGSFLSCIADDADRRQYRFDRTRILRTENGLAPIAVNDGQILYELALLRRKLASRSPENYARISDIRRVRLNCVFTVRTGGVEDWEKPVAGIIENMPEGQWPTSFS